jgi:hypothetical protein
VSDTLLDGLRLAPFGIHVMRIKITRLAGMCDNIAFGDGASKRGATTPDCVLIKQQRSEHDTAPCAQDN